MPQAVLKTEILYEQLLEELGRYSPGVQFMTNREIMKRFNVSQLVVDQTVARFRKAGFLRVVPGREHSRPMRSGVSAAMPPRLISLRFPAGIPPI